MPSQISNFENLEGVIRISGWPLLHVIWNYQAIPQNQALVIEADWLKRKEKPAAVEKPLEPPAEPTTASPFRLE